MVQLTFVVATLSPRHLLRCTLVAGVNPLSTFCTHGITSFTLHPGGWCEPSQYLLPQGIAAFTMHPGGWCKPSLYLLYPRHYIFHSALWWLV